MVGKTISHYEITEKLGEGGMGVVYKARDSHLKRFVALKVLPPEKVADPERKHRFVQEARSASALNHPNIVTVHDIDQSDGVDFIAMEYVEGKTLDDLIGRKGLKLNEALKYAVQIADALAKAHAAGIVHRDLKPGNVMVTAEGRVKVLDFGLAKLTEAAPDSQDGTTQTEHPATESGMIVGTVAYMSPEQAEGKKVDARSDIFSFGSLLYEMLTGRRAFSGDSTAAILAAVLKEEASPLGTEIPQDLKKLVKLCMRKDPARRLQHIDDVKVELDVLKDELGTNTQTPVATGVPTRRPAWWLRAIATGFLLLAATMGILWWKKSSSLLPQRTVPVTSYPGGERYPSFSPDGKQIAFTWNGEQQNNDDIYVKMAAADAAPLRLTTDPAPDLFPAWSPDGTQIAFVRLQGNKGAIYLASPQGGQQRKVESFRAVSLRTLQTDYLPSLSWSPDGHWLAAVELDGEETNGIFLIPVEEGEKQKLVSSPVSTSRFQFPAFSPNGRELAYASCTGNASCDLYVVELDQALKPKGQPRRVTRRGQLITGIAWAADGKAVVFSGGGAVTELDGYLWHAASDSTKEPEPIELAGKGAYSPAIALRGNRLVFTRAGRDRDIWKFEMGSPPQRFISTSLDEAEPQFSPDGKRIAFGSNRSSRGFDLWVVNQDGTNPVRLTEGFSMLSNPHWSPDGRWLSFSARQSAGGRWEIWLIDAAGGQPRRLAPDAPDERLSGSWSRDGRWVYFWSNLSGRYEVWRLPKAGGEAIQVTKNGGGGPWESWDGKTLYYVAAGRRLLSTPLSGGSGRQVLDSLGARTMLSYFPVENGIYWIKQVSEANPTDLELRFLEFASGSSRLLSRFQGDRAQGLTVSADRKTVLYSFYPASRNDDLVMIENFR